MFNKYRAQIGNTIRVTLTSGEAYLMTISQINDPVSMGLARYRGPQIIAHIVPGGYSINLDSTQIANIETL